MGPTRHPAGIARGLVAIGSASNKAPKLLTYAHDTQHEKVGGPARKGAGCAG